MTHAPSPENLPHLHQKICRTFTRKTSRNQLVEQHNTSGSFYQSAAATPALGVDQSDEGPGSSAAARGHLVRDGGSSASSAAAAAAAATAWEHGGCIEHV
jgi:hypothetical protein